MIRARNAATTARRTAAKSSVVIAAAADNARANWTTSRKKTNDGGARPSVLNDMTRACPAGFVDASISTRRVVRRELAADPPSSCRRGLALLWQIEDMLTGVA